MPVTRIKTNQITDSAVTTAKIADTAVTAGKLANNITYGSNLVISGNLTVSGTTTTVDSTNTTLADPIQVLSSGATGSASVDSGSLTERGDDTNVFIGWDESADQFIVASTTDDGTTAGNITVSAYQPLQVGSLIADDTTIDNNQISTSSGDLTLAPTGNINASSNRITSVGTPTQASDAATKSYVDSQLGSATTLVEGNTSIVASDSGSGTITMEIDSTTVFTATSSEVTMASAKISDLTNNRLVVAGTDGVLEDDGNLTFDGTTLTVGQTTIAQATGNTTVGGTLDVTGVTNFNDTTAATNTTSGAVIIDGGMGVAGAIHGGGTLDIAGAATLASTLAAGNTTVGTLAASGAANFNDTTSSTSNTTGAVIIDGGLGLAENLNMGGDADVDGNATIGGNLQVDGNSTIGSATSDTIALNGTINSDIAATSATGGKPDFTLTNTNADANGSSINFVKDSASPADDDALGNIQWMGDDDGGNQHTFAKIIGQAIDVTDGSEDGQIMMQTVVGGTITNMLRVGAATDGSHQIRANSSYTPSDNYDLATKTYVDSQISSAGSAISAGDTNVTVTDTGSDGKIAFNVDGSEIGKFEGTAFTAGSMVMDSNSLSATNTSITINPNSGGAANTGSVIIAGDLTVNGTTTTTNSTTVTIDDPIFTLGGDSAPGSDDGKDRGIEFRYYDSSAKIGFFGYDNSADEFVYLTDVTNTSEVMAGTAGNISVGNVKSSSLTSGRVVTAGANGLLEDNAGLTWDGTNLTTTGEYIGATLNISGAGDVGGDFTVATDKMTVTASNGNTDIAGTLTTAGAVNIDDTTASTSTTSGALIVDGGAGIAGNLYVGGTINGTGTTTFSGALDVTLTVTLNGGLTVASGQSVAMGGNKVTGVAEPTAGTDAATKNYVDSQIGDVTRLVEGNTTATVSDSGTGSFAVEVDSTSVLTAAASGVTMNSAVVSDLTNNRIVIAGTSGAVEDDANFRFNGTTFDIGASGSETFQVTVANGNTAVSGTLDATGKITASAALEVDGTATLATAVIEDLTDNRVLVAGTGGAVEDSANLTFDGTTLTTTDLTVDNIGIDGNSIVADSGNLIFEGTASGEIAMNEAGADVNFRVEASGAANALFVEGSSGNIGLGTATPSAALHVSSTGSMIIPVGTTGQRPGSAAQGMFRYNTTAGNIEVYTGSEWNSGADFTTITADSFNGDGSTVAFTLSTSGTTATTIVSLNGVVQIPTTAYGVSGTTLTFTEAPASGDVIDARVLATTSSITSMQDADADTKVEVEVTSDADEIQFTAGGTAIAKVTSAGIIPNVNSNGSTGFDLGASNAQWKDLYVSQGSLYVNGKQVIQDDSGTITVQTDANQNLKVTGGSGSGLLQLDAGSGIQLLRATTMGSGVGINAHADDSATGVLLPDGAKAANVTITGNSVKNDVTNENLVLQSNGSGVIQLNDEVSATGNVTIAGNLTVNGSTTTVSTTNTTVEDPLVIYATGQSGSPTYDAGFVVERGSSTNVAMIWDESDDTFAAITTAEDGTTAGNVTVAGYANMRVSTLTGTATAAQYADLAENYSADAEYAPGTVVGFGGSHEVTMCDTDGCRKIAGVVTSNPAYLMNAEMEADNVCAVALQGRVPVKVTGKVSRGDMMVSAGNGMARAEEDPKLGSVIGKALQDHDGEEGMIEVVVGRM